MIKLGIDNLDAYLPLFSSKRVGLITNHTGENFEHKSTIDILFEKTNLVALFSPEHGIRGDRDAGETVLDSNDTKTGLPIYSLYGETKKPTKEMLKGIDLLAIDIQDCGSRYYTFIYTMALSMMAAKENTIEFVVFDRPNPIGLLQVEGTHIEEKNRSFVGMFDIPQRHGMTIGEIAKLFNSEFQIGCKLTVVEMDGYTRDMRFEDTGLTFTSPTPNMRTIDTCYVYNATCLFEGTNVSEGRGTEFPFEQIGAPYIEGNALVEFLKDFQLPGVDFLPTSFTPISSKYKGELCHGVFLKITNRELFEAVKTGISLLSAFRTLYPKEFVAKTQNENGSPSHFANLVGDTDIITNTLALQEQFQKIENATKDFLALREKCLLYR